MCDLEQRFFRESGNAIFQEWHGYVRSWRSPMQCSCEHLDANDVIYTRPLNKKGKNIEHQQQQQLTQKCQFLKICLESIFNFRRSRFLQKSEKTSSNPAKFLINFENKQKLIIFVLFTWNSISKFPVWISSILWLMFWTKILIKIKQYI